MIMLSWRSWSHEHRALAVERFQRDCWIEGNPPLYAHGIAVYFENGSDRERSSSVIDISDWKYAEAIFHYIQIPEVNEQFQIYRELEALSMAEFVAKYKLDEFTEWYEKYRHLFE